MAPTRREVLGAAASLPSVPQTGSPGFRGGIFTSPVVQTAAAGNRIVIRTDPTTGEGTIEFYTGVTPEEPGTITSAPQGAPSRPTLVIRSGTYDGTNTAQIALNGSDAGSLVPTEVRMSGESLRFVGFARWPITLASNQASGIAQVPQLGIPTSGVVIAGALRGAQPWLVETAELNTTTSPAGDVLIPWDASFSGIGSLVVAYQGGAGPCVVERQAVNLTGAVFRVYSVAGAPIVSTPVVVDYTVAGW